MSLVCLVSGVLSAGGAEVETCVSNPAAGQSQSSGPALIISKALTQ